MLQCVSVQTLGLVLCQNLLDGLHALFRHIVEGCAALANGVTLQGNGGLDDGVGVAVLEGLLQDGNGVLCSLCALQISGSVHPVAVLIHRTQL